MTKLGKFPNTSVKALVAQAVGVALADAALDMGSIEAAWFSNTRQGAMEGQNGIRGQCALSAMGFRQIPIVNVENACASGSTALREAIAHIRAQMCDVALVVGAEKMYFPEMRDEMFRAFLGGTDVHLLDETRASFARVGTIREMDSAGPQHSFFMDMYAAYAQLHMKMFGTTQRQIAIVAAKNHDHSSLNPFSQYTHRMTPDAVLSEPLIAWPLTRSMCAPISDGAAAAVVISERARRRLWQHKGRPYRVTFSRKRHPRSRPIGL